MSEPVALTKKLVIEVDVLTGKMHVTNEDEMTYIEVMGALEYAKMMFYQDWMEGE